MLTLIIKGLENEKVKSEYIKGNSIIYHEKKLATIQHQQGEVVFQIHPQLDMAEYEIIRELILPIADSEGVLIDESGCQLGYLETGEKAYLIKNWEPWKAFLMKAKLRTLEGQNVIVKNEEEEELGNGLLAEYQINSDPFRLTSITLITTFGEKTFKGKNLLIEPTNLFG
ncbi:hypothetical protein [Bacillus sp. B15-48]|uniref:hypothetical protein n=1 Tax=Bacillus sp. B15-48 TaxID=1548601 RepID=UPI00193F387A|nr:hypothetical protein [Bacillus sp. B15-48]MBM4765055.1 hypothetical protein [Bacillus sp. B15-48]